MIGIIIASHGSYAKALISSIEMVCGKQEKLEAVCLDAGESIEGLNIKIKEAIKNLDVNEVLIFVDILGGTPYNAGSFELDNPNVNIVTGVNMSMILDILPHRDESLMILSKLASDAGKSGIVNVKEKFQTLNKRDGLNAENSEIR